MRKSITLLTLFFLAALQVWAQDRVITGKITDENGQPVMRSTVQVKGTNVGTTTTDDGSFSLQVHVNARTLVVSFIGMANKEVSLRSGCTYAVCLAPATTQNMQEVVVV